MMAAGGLAGACTGLAMLEVTRGLLPLVGEDAWVYLMALLSALLAPTRGRLLVWAAALSSGAAILLLSLTPIAVPLVRGHQRSDPPRSAPAVVVLASSTTRAGNLAGTAQERVIRGYELLQQGYSDRLILTSTPPPFRAWPDAVARQLDTLRIKTSVEVIGPARNTYEEAVVIGKLARERGWKEVLLVTHPVPMRRAELCLLKQGVRPICVPCEEGRYDLDDLLRGSSRREAFRDWLHEWIGILVYRLKGRI